MMTSRTYQGNGRTATRAAYYQLLMATIVAAYLMTSCNCLPTSEGKHSHSDGKVLLSSAIGEFEDALSRLKQYAKDLSDSDKSSDNEDEDPLAESIELEPRDEDYRQEPELVPGLGRFEKNLDEAAVSLGRSSSSDKDDLNGESRANEPSVKSTTKLTTVSASGDISVKDLMEFLRERKSQKNKDHTGQVPEVLSERSGEAKAKTAADKDDNSKVALKDALEYLASLKKKLSENERTA